MHAEFRGSIFFPLTHRKSSDTLEVKGIRKVFQFRLRFSRFSEAIPFHYSLDCADLSGTKPFRFRKCVWMRERPSSRELAVLSMNWDPVASVRGGCQVTSILRCPTAISDKQAHARDAATKSSSATGSVPDCHLTRRCDS